MTRARVEIDIDGLQQSLLSQIESNIKDTTEEYASDLYNRLDDPGSYGPRSGRDYFIMGRTHRASAAGEPPAVLTGELRDSIDTHYETEGHKISGYAYSSDEKALWMELGTGERYTTTGRYTGRIEPRPAWRTIFMENMAKYSELMTQPLEW